MAAPKKPVDILSRRDFIQTTTVATAGLLASGHFAYAAGTDGPRENMIGTGDFTYTMDHDWAKVPAGKQFGYTHGVVEDRQGRIYIANQSRDAIMVFDAEGHFLSSWGQAYAKGAHGLTIATEGDEEVLYLANTSLAEVVKTTLDGEVIWKAGRPYRPDVYTQDNPYSPTETAIAPDGTVYVADGYGQSWIHIYASDGTYLHSFGGPGEDETHLNGPHGITIDRRSGTPIVQVSDRNNVRIVNFTLEGEYLGVAIPPADLRFPCTTVHAGDLLYIPDLFTRVSIFDKDNKKLIDLGDYVEGQALTAWGDFGTKYADLDGYPNIPHEKRYQDKFISPHSLWVDRQGNIYVVEWINDGRVTKLTKQ